MSEKSEKKNTAQRANINDVANMAGVSKTHISRFLSGEFRSMSEETRNRIEKTIATLNYRPNRMARGLKRDRSYLIGFVMADIANPYSTGILRGAEDVCKKHGYNLLVCNTDNNPTTEKDYIYLLQAHRIDGLLISTTGYNNDILREISNDFTSVVLMDRKISELELDLIGTDNLKATNEAIEFLLESGYERIGYFSEPFGNTSTRLERVHAFREYLRKRDHPSHEDVYEIDVHDSEQLELKLNQYLTSTEGRTRAIFAGNSVILLKIINALHKKGLKIPEHVSVMGFDDTEWAPVVGTGITTIEQPTYQIGVLAMERILLRIQGNKEPVQTIHLPTQLLVRGSTPTI